MIDDYRCQYLKVWRHGAWDHRWSIADEKNGALEFWYREREGDMDYPCAGLEAHYRKPPNYMNDKKASHEVCQILCAPCWHDGSSLAGSDFYEVHIQHNRSVSDEQIFRDLASRFGRYFDEQESK